MMIKRKTVTLTDAQIKALPTTPIDLVPAPPAGYRIKVLGLSMFLRCGGGAYTNINATYADLHVRLGNGDYSIWPLLLNDNAPTTDVTQVSQYFGAAADSVHDLSPRELSAVQGAATTGTKLNVINMQNGGSGYTPTAWDASALSLGMDNNGSGNLTGGNAGNTLIVIVYHVREKLS